MPGSSMKRTESFTFEFPARSNKATKYPAPRIRPRLMFAQAGTRSRLSAWNRSPVPARQLPANKLPCGFAKFDHIPLRTGSLRLARLTFILVDLARALATDLHQNAAVTAASVTN